MSNNPDEIRADMIEALEIATLTGSSVCRRCWSSATSSPAPSIAASSLRAVLAPPVATVLEPGALDERLLKIDGSFVARLGTDRRCDDLVRTIAQLGLNLGLEIIAEALGAELGPLQDRPFDLVGADHGVQPLDQSRPARRHLERREIA